MNKILFPSFCAVLFVGLSFIGQPVPMSRHLAGRDESPYRLRVPVGLDEYVPIPEDNPLTAVKIDLGKKLFFDKGLSRDHSIACSSCHIPEKAFANESPVAVGVKGLRGNRNVPSIVNRAYGKSHFWDGRAKSLEEQALEPIQNPREMNLPLGELENRLASNGEYRKTFEDVFGEKPTAQNSAKALATFVRSLLFANSAYDRFVHGDREALTESAKRGLQIFRGKGNCIACHVGPNFTDEKFHNTGVAYLDSTISDWGRSSITKRDRDKGAFKTPTLREISRTAPYVHNGVLATLEEVIEFYEKGGESNPHLDEEIRPLKLSPQEKQNLLAFLHSLNSNKEKFSAE